MVISTYNHSTYFFKISLSTIVYDEQFLNINSSCEKKEVAILAKVLRVFIETFNVEIALKCRQT